MTKIQAVAYARISQDKWLGEQEGLAVERQLHAILEYAKNEDIEITREYVDNSISATSGKLRPAFEEMLHAKPDYIVVWHYDRLVRVPKDLEKVLDTEATVFQVKGSHVDLATHSGKMMARMLVSIATYEGEHKAERQKAKNAQLARDGVYRGTQRPMGNYKDGRLHNEEATLLRKEIRDYIQGQQTLYGIVKSLNEAGVKTSYGNDWVTASIKRALQRPSLKGWQEYEGTLYKLKDWESVLTEEEWADLQARLGSTKSEHSERWKNRPDISLLTSIARCWKCERGLNTAYAEGGKKAETKGAVRRQYKCPQGHVYVQAPLLEKLVILSVMTFVAGNGEKEDSQTAQRRLQLLEEIEKVQTEHDEWMTEAIEAGLKPSAIAARDAVVEKQLEELKAERNVLATSPYMTFFDGAMKDVEVSGESMVDNFNQMGINARRDLVRHYIEKIIVNKGQVGKHGSLQAIQERVDITYTDKVDGFMLASAADTIEDFG